MSVDLSDYVDPLVREVTPPGFPSFANLNTVSDTQWVGYLSDAFWEVRLDGFPAFKAFSCDPYGIVLPQGDPQVQNGDSSYTPTTYNPSADLKRSEIALIILYAGIKILRNSLMNNTFKTVAKAGPVEFEQDYSSNVLVEMLKELTDAKKRLQYLKTFNQDVYLIDAFSARSASASVYAGYLYDFFVGGDGFAFGSPYTDQYDVTGIF